jgi:hypothetical protein
MNIHRKFYEHDVGEPTEADLASVAARLELNRKNGIAETWDIHLNGGAIYRITDDFIRDYIKDQKKR